MMRASYPSRTAGPATFRTASRVPFERRLRGRPGRTQTAGTVGVIWSVGMDWDGDGYDPGDDDITGRALMRSTLQAEFGRDKARALMPMTSGRASAELDNIDRALSPDNAASPLVGRILPGRPFRIQARLDGTTYTLFDGHGDDYTVQARIDQRSVDFGALDAIAKLKDIEISTQLYAGIRTGTALGYVLDAIGWPDDQRDLDPGATIIRWWWEEATDAYKAITDLLLSEGPGAVIHADAGGKIVFRDRHHRLLNAASITPQITFDPDDGVGFEDLKQDVGWADIINVVALKVEELDPASFPETVWESPDVRSIAASTTLEITVTLDDPATDLDVAFTTLAGTVTGSIVQDSGQTLTLKLTPGASAAAVSDLVVTGRPVTVARTYQVTGQDDTSIGRYGKRNPFDKQGPWAGVRDAEAIADLVLGARAERLPVVTVTMSTKTDVSSERLVQQLGRDLSDRIHVREAETCIDYDFYLGQIKHRVSDGGMLLRTEFTMEKAPTQASDVFRFNDSDHGFNDGVFGATGLDDPENLFIFDQDGHGFDDGVFAT
ncbi:hypothetical protein GCM10022254_10050 [Actinomadura meridiana]|uniref:Tip attachment protein J domain-containing protein n=1 Tax=Actinomadura meridiana TaxID=559626 RepID=A0ABP8BUA5_9ACTN